MTEVIEVGQERARELENGKTPQEEVTINVGTTILVKFSDSADPLKLTIVYTGEANPSGGKISNECPLGIALMGKSAGVTVTYDTLDGEIECGILAILEEDHVLN